MAVKATDSVTIIRVSDGNSIVAMYNWYKTVDHSAGVEETGTTVQTIVESDFPDVDVKQVEIEGKAFKWNQLASTNFTQNNVTITESNGVFTVTPVDYNSNWSLSNNSTGDWKGSILGHKYYMSCEQNPTTSYSTRMYMSGVSSNYFALTANVWNLLEYIFVPTDANPRQSIFVYSPPTLSDFPSGNSVQTKNCRIYDLTAMFGSGNEPSTVEAFKATEQYKAMVRSGKLYTYDPGSIQTTCGAARGPWNRVDLGTLTWDIDSGWSTPVFYASIADMVSSYTNENFVCRKYITTNFNDLNANPRTGYICSRNGTSGRYGVIICDTSYSTAAEFKSAMSGVYLYYEPATVTTDTKYYAYDGLNVEQGGRNLIKFPYSTNPGTIQGVIWTVNNDGSITVNGTASGDSYFNLDFTSNIERFHGQTLTMSGVAGIRCQCGAFKSDGSYSSMQSVAGSASFVVPNWAIKLRLFLAVNNGNTVNNVTVYPQLELGTSATPYQPYEHSTYQNVLANTYLASVNDVHDSATIGRSGTTVNRKIGVVDLGSLNWTMHASSGTFYTSCGKKAGSRKLNCDGLIADGLNFSFNSASSYPDNIIRGNSSSTDARVFVKCTSYTDAASFKAAMNGVLLYFELETPTTETLPAVQLGKVFDRYSEFKTNATASSEMKVNYVDFIPPQKPTFSPLSPSPQNDWVNWKDGIRRPSSDYEKVWLAECSVYEETIAGLNVDYIWAEPRQSAEYNEAIGARQEAESASGAARENSSQIGDLSSDLNDFKQESAADIAAAKADLSQIINTNWSAVEPLVEAGLIPTVSNHSDLLDKYKDWLTIDTVNRILTMMDKLNGGQNDARLLVSAADIQMQCNSSKSFMFANGFQATQGVFTNVQFSNKDSGTTALALERRSNGHLSLKLSTSNAYQGS